MSEAWQHTLLDELPEEVRESLHGISRSLPVWLDFQHGLISSQRLGTSAREQRLLAQAIKRARYMALLPYTSATL